MPSTPYEPEVNDYVIWERDTWARTEHDEGWVYFKGDVVEPKKGFNTPVRYITIETHVRLKPIEQLKDSPLHKYVHTLLLCYEHQWHQLKYVKRRKHKECNHYSEYDDIAGNDE